MKANKTRGFELVSSTKTKHSNTTIKLPSRGTSKAMAYDFFSPDSYAVEPNQIVKIWSDVKSYMQDDECLILNVRSSMGGKFMMAHTQGWIDSDYYNNPNNEGNIGIFLKNISDETQFIYKGDRICQGVFMKYLVADNDTYLFEERTGGHGSTGE